MSAAEEFVWSVKNGELEKVKAYVDSKKVKPRNLVLTLNLLSGQV